MMCEILMNLYIWSHSTDESDSEEFIKYSENIALDVCQLIPLATMCILGTMKRGHKVIIEFAY